MTNAPTLYTTRSVSLDSAMRISMVSDLLKDGLKYPEIIMVATDAELISMHRKAFPTPFFDSYDVTAALAKLTIFK